MKQFKYLIYILLFCSISNCKKNQEIDRIKRSALDNIDLFLISNKFNILEADWINLKSTSKFDKTDLIRHLQSYGRTIDDLKENPKLEYHENENIIELKVKRTAHSTSYDYDTNIPIIFYGPNWFQKGEFSESIHQQHIVPTLAKILKIRNPNGVETHPITNIIKPNSEANLPEIIVTIVLDQTGQQFYKSHPEVPIQISRIKKDSAYFPNALVGHVDAETAVGHAAIGTGAYPNKNGIIANAFISSLGGKISKVGVYASDDRLVNPTELLTETLADVLDNEYHGESEIISQCFALRAAIGMAGHGASKIKSVDYVGDKDIVYWYYSTQSEWITDNRYFTFPPEASSYNPLKTFKEEYPDGWEGAKIDTLEDIPKNWSALMGNPAETKAEGELFRKVIQNHIIAKGKHKDGIPDLAYFTIKATDAIAHQFGYESIQAKETFREADKQVGLIFEMLQKEYGDKFILVITADHGGTPLPEISGGERLTQNELFSEINDILPPGVRETENLVNFMTINQIALNRDVMKKNSITESQIIDKIMKIKVNKKPFFKKVYTKNDLR